ncbi:MAG: hypothetical protein ACE5JP_13410 [Candidatus Bipolaricaulia bacterium]
MAETGKPLRSRSLRCPRLAIWGTVGLLVLSLLLSGCSSGRREVISDDFEDGTLDETLWIQGYITQDPGIHISESFGTLSVSGISTQPGWSFNGISSHQFLRQNVEVSVEFKKAWPPTFPEELNVAIAQLFLESSDRGRAFGVGYYYHEQGYRTSWKRSGDPFVYTDELLPGFGNEVTSFHTLKIKYNATTDRVEGYVDDRLIGSTEIDFPNFKIQLKYAPGEPEVKPNVSFDNFRAVLFR